jgi:glycerol-3-phosphate dehydrogenase (NAD(P)+)
VKRLAVLGAGSWGTALAIALAARFEAVCLWARDAGQAMTIAAQRENARYLAGFRIPGHVEISHDLQRTISGADIVLSVVPSRYLREVIDGAAESIAPNTPVVSATKGIEEISLRRMSQVISEALRVETLGTPSPVAVLSGPTFAREIAAGEPAAIVIAAAELGVAEQIQRAFSTPTLRFYTSQDVIGVEIGAALKNVIALGAGICSGLGLGSNSVAALVTRGLAEITRLAVVLGGKERTLSGLAGLGDLVLTATGNLSRNRAVGLQLGQGRKLPEILAQTTMVAEGVSTCRAAYQLALRHNVSLPIIAKMHEVLNEDKDPRIAIRELMDRPLTSE